MVDVDDYVAHVLFGRRDQRPNASLEPTFCSFFQCLWSNEEVDPIPKSWLADSGIRRITAGWLSYTRAD
jgi:hypothetical protein